MNSKQLAAYCNTSHQSRAAHQPRSWGKWTFATNGKIIVIVPRIKRVPELPKELKWPTLEKAIRTAVSTRRKTWQRYSGQLLLGKSRIDSSLLRSLQWRRDLEYLPTKSNTDPVIFRFASGFAYVMPVVFAVGE